MNLMKLKLRLTALWLLYVLCNIVRYRMGTLNILAVVTGTLSGLLLIWFLICFHGKK